MRVLRNRQKTKRKTLRNKMGTAFTYGNQIEGTLLNDVQPGQTEIPISLNNGQGIPASSSETPTVWTITSNSDDGFEIVSCIGVNGYSLTVIRGCDGTSARAFVAGDTVSLRATAGQYDTYASNGYLGVFNPNLKANGLSNGYAQGAIALDPSRVFYWISKIPNNNESLSNQDAWQKLDLLNLASSIESFSSAALVPIGASIMMNGSKDPSTEKVIYKIEDGSTFDPNTYPELYAQIQSTTLPNSSGRFIRNQNNELGGQVNPDNTPIMGNQNQAVLDPFDKNGGSGSFNASCEQAYTGATGCFSLGHLFGADGYEKHSHFKTYTFDFNLKNPTLPIGNENRPSAHTKLFLIRVK